MTAGVALLLAEWAAALRPTGADLSLARRALTDTAAVGLAGQSHSVARFAGEFGAAGRRALVGHVLDFDDLHMPSTTHVSVVCVSAVLGVGGGARDYLVGAGVMARLGTALGWPHYAAGWHATCTAGTPAAAAAGASALGLDAERIGHAVALAVSAAGGVQRAFGTDAKSLQVAAAVDAGVRAARLAAAGARSDLHAVDDWLELVGGSARRLVVDGPAVPGGLAVKLHPCCYALQRPIAAVASIRDQVDVTSVSRITVRTPAASVRPLIRSRPRTGLEGKFSLEYAVAAALLDEHVGFDSFTDVAVRRPEAQRLAGCVEVELTPGGEGLLDGEFTATVHTLGGSVDCAETSPPGAPDRPPTRAQLAAKVDDCVAVLGSRARPGTESVWRESDLSRWDG